MIEIMRYRWDYDELDLQRLREIVAAKAGSGLVRARIARNLASSKPSVGRGRFWNVLVACLLTSVQRSGPDSPVSNFLKLSPFPLRLEICEADCDLANIAQDHLREFGGIRFGPKIAKQLCENVISMAGGDWDECASELERLRTEQTLEAERRAARFLDDQFVGIGPKQSRNLLQILGLTRYEIPIDSRIIKWLRRFRFPVPLSSAALSDADYYEFVEDGIHILCHAAGVVPCVLDAAIFASFDNRDWTDEESLW
jgi:hypothetical protein